MSRKCLSSEAALTHLVPNPMRWGSVIMVISIFQMGVWLQILYTYPSQAHLRLSFSINKMGIIISTTWDCHRDRLEGDIGIACNDTWQGRGLINRSCCSISSTLP